MFMTAKEAAEKWGDVPVMSANNNNTIMKSTIEILSLLNETELTAVNAVIKAYISRPNKDNPFSNSLEQELYDMIDKALANADKGVCKDPEDLKKNYYQSPANETIKVLLH